MATIRPYGFLSEEEKATMPKISIKLIRRMTSYLKPFLIPLGFMFILTAVSSSVSLVPQIISKNIVDDALLGKNMKLLILLLGASLGFAVLNFFINNLCSYFKRKVNWKLSIHLKTQLFNKLVSMDHDFFKNEKQSDIKERLTVDVSDVVDSILEILPEIISSLAVFVTAFTVIGRTVDWRLIITGLAIFPLEILPKRLNNQKSFNKREKMREMNKNGSHFVDENLCVNGSLLMKLFTKEKSISEQYAKIHQERYELSNKTHKEGNFFKLLILILSKINSLLVYFVAGYLMIVQKNDAISVGSITMTIALSSRLTRPVNMLLNSHSEMLRGFAAFNRIIGYLDKENKIVPPVKGVQEKVCDGSIEFSHVDFSYTEDAPLLKDVSFKLPAGKCFALVGPSGAGKSSIINLIPRLYDATGGSITFDGVNIKDIDLEYLRSNIGVVTQDTVLFNGTILENLKYAKEDATQEEIEEACKNANIHDFIVSQPDGYESLVGNGGLKLSGGERQRIAIARVLLKNPKILILDEATSALDSINEAAIQNSLDRLLVGRTSIIIAHRLSTILKADNIMVLKEGQIVEQGTHKELVELNGTYCELYDTQFKKVLNSGKKEFGQIYKVQKLDNEFSK